MQPTRHTWPAPLCHRILGRGRSRHLIYYRMVHPRDKQYDVQVRVILDLERWPWQLTRARKCSMTGALNKLPVAASGMIFFGDPVTLGSVTAITVGFFAGILYAIAKNNQKKTDGAAKAETIIPMTRKE
jgi:hypothetical protein